jgi:hypothetical protein
MLLYLISISGFAAQLEFVDGKCKHSPVPNYISQTSLYDFQVDYPTAEEIQKANELAIRSLVLPKCAGVSEKACLVIQSKVRVVDYIFEKEIKQICSLSMLSAEVAKNPLGDQQELSSAEYVEQLAQLIYEDLRAQISTNKDIMKTSVWVQNPVLEKSECSAGMMGKHIQSVVKDKLLELKVPLSIHASFELPSIGIQFTIGDPWSVDIFFQDTTGMSSLLSHFEIPSSYMPPNSQTCLEAQSLGLEHVKSNPALRFEIELEKNVFCEGDVIHPIVRSSIPSQMVVLSLLADGTAYLIWPGVGVERKISSELDLGAFEAVPTSSSGEERLVIIGVPEGENLGLLMEMNSFCKLTDWQKYVPKNASIKTSSYQILPAGIGGCSYGKLDAKKRFNYTRTLERVPKCK